MNPYEIDTVEEAAVAVRELREKGRVLHEARMRAHGSMRAAINEHEFMQKACARAEREENEMIHRLERLVRRDAERAVA